jgi:mRNA interferase RelE/StbE
LPELFLTRRARQDLTALPEHLQVAVLETLDDVRADPREAGKELVGRLRGLWSARVGSYRVLYTIEGSEASLRVIVRSIRHRAIAYGDR